MNTRTKKYIFYSNQCENLNSRYSHSNKYRKMGHDFGFWNQTNDSLQYTTYYYTVLKEWEKNNTTHMIQRSHRLFPQMSKNGLRKNQNTN